MDPVPKWIQGVAYNDGNLYVTCDDGDAEEDAPDHMYRIEGLCFDRESSRFLLLYNRGARIILGMPKGFYEGYTEEIHEVFVFDVIADAP